jgi:hypothetical protein
MLIAQAGPNYMLPVPGTGASVHVVVLIAGLACLLMFVVVMAVLLVVAASGARRHSN